MSVATNSESPTLRMAIQKAFEYLIRGPATFVKTERVDAVLADGTLIVGGASLRTSGSTRGIQAGSLVQVLYSQRPGTQILDRRLVLQHQARRGLTAGQPPIEVAGLVEELYLLSPPDSILGDKQYDVWLRTEQFFARIMSHSAGDIDMTSDEWVTGIQWGLTDNMFYLEITDRTWDGFGPVPIRGYLVYKLDRPTGTTSSSPPTVSFVRRVELPMRELVLGSAIVRDGSVQTVTFGEVWDSRGIGGWTPVLDIALGSQDTTTAPFVWLLTWRWLGDATTIGDALFKRDTWVWAIEDVAGSVRIAWSIVRHAITQESTGFATLPAWSEVIGMNGRIMRWDATDKWIAWAENLIHDEWTHISPDIVVDAHRVTTTNTLHITDVMAGDLYVDNGGSPYVVSWALTGPGEGGAWYINHYDGEILMSTDLYDFTAAAASPDMIIFQAGASAILYSGPARSQPYGGGGWTTTKWGIHRSLVPPGPDTVIMPPTMTDDRSTSSIALNLAIVEGRRTIRKETTITSDRRDPSRTPHAYAAEQIFLLRPAPPGWGLCFTPQTPSPAYPESLAPLGTPAHDSPWFVDRPATLAALLDQRTVIAPAATDSRVKAAILAPVVASAGLGFAPYVVNSVHIIANMAALADVG